MLDYTDRRCTFNKALSDRKNIEFHPRRALNEATYFSATEIKSLATAVCVCEE